ncbi:helix-turn-helix transcriptional regulator [Vibrio sp. S4M6]|uniref:helix-turn-helix transcriptional regulator n=1 Tax=Vibrio sinus TaxID=2946865 RepID=UPI00202AB05C|nr:helix-turn-helix transcriptional regulator [Vibrio sinus]MCL9780647.1 helix-turn-helix transcriptional regulator [Vibrio sinus]
MTNPIRWIKSHHGSATNADWHQHDYAQVYWVCRGCVEVETKSEQWTVTNGCLGWISPSVEHSARIISSVDVNILYIQTEHFSGLPTSSKLVRTNELIHALLNRLLLSDFTIADTAQQRRFQVLLDEIHDSPSCDLFLPLPEDKRVRKIADLLLTFPDDERLQPELAHEYGLSTRTLSRLFKSQTGMSFGAWRQQAKLISSLPLLAKGNPVTSVALECGYDNTSSYITAFKKRFGSTPSQYFE